MRPKVEKGKNRVWKSLGTLQLECCHEETEQQDRSLRFPINPEYCGDPSVSCWVLQ